MIKRKGVLCGMLLTTTLFLSGSAFASEVNTPNADFNEIGNDLALAGFQQTTSPNGDVLIGTPGDPLVSYGASTGDWIYYGIYK